MVIHLQHGQQQINSTTNLNILILKLSETQIYAQTHTYYYHDPITFYRVHQHHKYWFVSFPIFPLELQLMTVANLY